MTLLSESAFGELEDEVHRRIYQQMEFAWQNDQLDDFLRGIGMADLATPQSVQTWDDSLPYGKIIVFGDSFVKESEIVKSIVNQGITKNRIELHLGYEELKRFNFSSLQFNSAYRLILVGPLPHSTKGKDSFSSVITRMEQEEGFTKLVRLVSNNQLKVTKSNIKEAIRVEVDSGYLAAG